MKKEIEKELKKELNMDIKGGSKVIYRFSNGQELIYFRNDELKINNLELVFHESHFDGISGKYQDRTKDYKIVSRDFESIINEVMEINKKYFLDRSRTEEGFFCGKIGKVLQ